MKSYRKKHPDTTRKWNKNANKSRRMRALIVINSSLVCKCGRGKVSFLEIHHRNRDGKKDRKELKGSSFYDAIIQGKRKINDLEVVCKICNLEDYIEQLKEEYNKD